jgi:hypothetical protein
MKTISKILGAVKEHAISLSITAAFGLLGTVALFALNSYNIISIEFPALQQQVQQQDSTITTIKEIPEKVDQKTELIQKDVENVNEKIDLMQQQQQLQMQMLQQILNMQQQQQQNPQ